MSEYYSGDGLGIGALGRLSSMGQDDAQGPGSIWYAYSVLSMIGSGTGVYHGYRRNHGSIGWALGWSVFGGFLPIFSIPLSLAQGYAKPAVRANRRRRRTSRITRRRRTSRRSR